MNNFKTLSSLVAFAAALAVTNAEARELRLSTIAPENHNWTWVAREVSKELAAHPELDLQLTVFAGGQLGGEPETLQQIELGLIDMGLFTVATLASRAPSMNGWFTPYLFSDVREAGAARSLPEAQQMLEELQGSGVVGLGYTMAGMRHIMSRGAPIQSGVDMANKKVRITPFDAAKTWWEAIGAVPTPVPVSSVYQSIQSGVVDLVETDLDLINSLSLQEVAKGLTMTGHMVFPGGIVISQQVLDDLTPEQQRGLRDAVEKASAEGVEAQIKAEETNFARVSANITVVRLSENAAGFEAAAGAFDAKFGRIPLVSAFQDKVRAAK